jgi:hypothetical protein
MKDVAEYMGGVSVSSVKRRVSVAWQAILELPEVGAIIRAARLRRMIAT